AVVPPPAAAMPAPLPDYSKTFPTPMSSQQAAVQGLGSLRGFSAILTHSLDAEAMLKQFLLLLREMMGINRAAVFLRQPSQWLGGEQLALDDNRRLRAACALGLSTGLVGHFELSFENGIGGQVTRSG